MKVVQSFKKLGIITGAMAFLLLGVIGCGTNSNSTSSDSTNGSSSSSNELKTISDILEHAAIDQKVNAKGTIYYITESGFYISDSEVGNIFVSNTAETTEVELGKEVEINGKFTKIEEGPVIQPTSFKVLGAGVLPTAQYMGIDIINGQKKDDKVGTWYRYIELKGKITKNTATNLYEMSDDSNEKIEFSEESTGLALSNHSGKRVSVKAVISQYSIFGRKWRVTFIGNASEVNLAPYTQSEIRGKSESYFDSSISNDVFGGLSLPSTLPNVDDLLITWVSNSSNIEVLPKEANATNYRTKVIIPNNDVSAKLVATVTYLDQAPFTVDKNVVVKNVPVTSVSAILQTPPTTSFIMVKGLVIAIVKNYTDTVRSYLLQDPLTKKYITVDFDKNVAEGNFGQMSLSKAIVGDEVIIGGTFLSSSTRPTLTEVTIVDKTGTTLPVVHDLENAIDLSSQASWETFTPNAGKSQLVKISSAFMRYSTSSMPGGDNWIRLGNTPGTVGAYYGAGLNKSIAFNVRQFDEVLGSNWRIENNIPTTGGLPVMFDGYFYAYFMYESSSYLQYAIVDSSHVYEENRAIVKREIMSSIPKSLELGDKLNLPTSHRLVNGEIEWTSFNNSIIDSNGNVYYPLTTTDVMMSVQYQVQGQNIRFEFIINVAGTTRIIKSVEELLAMNKEKSLVSAEGIILSFVTDTSTTAPYNTAPAMMVQDLNTGRSILVINPVGENGKPLITIDKTTGKIITTLKVGDHIDFDASLQIITEGNEKGKKSLRYVNNLTVISQNNPLVDYRSKAITITSHNQLVEYFKYPDFGQVILIKGTIYMNGSTSSLSKNTNIRFHMNPEVTKDSIDSSKYGGKSLALHVAANDLLLGENWIEEKLGFTTSYPSTDWPGVAFTGEMYISISYASSSYYRIHVLNAADMTLTKVK